MCVYAPSVYFEVPAVHFVLGLEQKFESLVTFRGFTIF